VLDLGGGTGRLADVLDSAQRYVCLDLDGARLREFGRRHPHGRAVVGDAARVPFATGTIDLVVCAAVSHHLTDESLDAMIREARRVLRADGTLVFMDAVWERRRLGGRLLWRYDQGSHPRTASALGIHLTRHFDIRRTEEFAIIHGYLIVIGTPRGERDGNRFDAL